MRLIDLDKVKWQDGFYDMHTGEQFAPMMFNTPEAIEWAIAEAEVDAISIEWIKSYVQKLVIRLKDNIDLGEDGPTREIVTIEDMLDDWEKENDR